MRLAAVKIVAPCSVDGQKRKAGVVVVTTNIRSAVRACRSGKAVPVPVDDYIKPENVVYECR